MVLGLAQRSTNLGVVATVGVEALGIRREGSCARVGGE